MLGLLVGRRLDLDGSFELGRRLAGVLGGLGFSEPVEPGRGA